jgi:hydroxyacylglutathione hydrolase
MKITSYTGGFVETNGYLIETPDGNFLIDAPQGVTAWCAERGVRVDTVLLTHQHYDHVTDAAALVKLGAKLHAFADYSTDLTLETPARAAGLPMSVVPFRIDHLFEMDRPLRLAGLEILLAHVPGHSPDSVVFYLADHGVVFSGDTLFAGSVGRTDLPGGSSEQLLSGIAKHLLTLSPTTHVLPGHGPASTIGEEANSNPYLG